MFATQFIKFALSAVAHWQNIIPSSKMFKILMVSDTHCVYVCTYCQNI